MNLRPVIVLALAAAAGLPLQAAAGADSAWQFSGFATAGAVYTNSDELQIARVGIDAPGGNRVDTGPDSVIGVTSATGITCESAMAEISAKPKPVAPRTMPATATTMAAKTK